MSRTADRIGSLWRRLRRSAQPPSRPAAPARRPHALVRRVRRQLNADKLVEAQSVVDLELAAPEPSTDAHLAAGLVAHRRRLFDLALHHFERGGPQAAWITPLPYLESLFAVDPDRGLDLVREWVADEQPRVKARTWHTALRYVLVHGDSDLRRSVHDRLLASYTGDDAAEWPAGETEIAWLDRWLDSRRNAVAPSNPGRVPFAVMDYVQPGRGKTSQNIGDHIQTLSSLGHLVRRPDLRFHGDDDLTTFVSELQGRVRPELRLDGPATDVQLYRVDRDASTFQAFPEGTWLLEFGWHMHDLAGVGVWDLPLHPALRPIFVSFHCNKRGLLTDEVVDYLRSHGPVGCRDWTTVDLLLSLDVPAFFSGCLTTTVSTVFPDLEQGPTEDATVYVDAVREPVPAGAVTVKQSYRRVKDRTFVENMREAVRLLEWYRHEFTHVVTKRLHCYLPTTSLGMQVDFQPANNADVRFNGLFRLDHDAFEAIRTGMLARLEPVLSAILAGAGEDEVYALWRSTVAAEVEHARARHRAPLTIEPPAVAPAELTAALAVRTGTDDAVDVVFLPGRADVQRLGPAVAAVDEGTAGPLRVWIVLAEQADVELPPVSSTTQVRVVDAGPLDLGSIGVNATQRPHSVLLAHLLPDVARAVILPVDGVVLGDVAELAATDLDGRAVAGRVTSGSDPSGFGVLYRAARRLDDAPDVAYEFYRHIHARHVFDFDAFDTGVLVMDLDLMRSSGFADEALALMRDYRLTAREALHLITGPHRAEIDPSWDHVPTRDLPVAAPKLVHWVDATKPWHDSYVALQETWPGVEDRETVGQVVA
ncbi:glycosyltransferase [Isoptericola jiangsuensis]|uniref:glycosyltransferase n=1 Tax=Isoptericola jiangsuensis TaxID=548579 RepID=UPI003AAAF629